MSGIAERFRSGLFAVLVGQLVLILGSFLLVPVFLAHWSPTRYGEWLAIFSLAGYLATLDPGIRLAVINRLTQAFAREDLREYALYQHSAFLFYLVLALAGSAAVALAAGFLPLGEWLGLRVTGAFEARWAIALLGVQVLWSIPAGFVTAVYRTNGNFPTSQWISNLRQLAAFALIALVLVAGGGVVALAASQLLPLLAALWAFGDIRRRFPALVPGLSKARLSALREMLPLGLSFAVIDAALLLVHQGSVILVSVTLGGAAVALFVTSRTLASLMRQVVRALVIPLWPELTALEARRERENLQIVHRLLVIGTASFSLAVSSALWFHGPEVIAVWTGGRLEPDATLLRLLLLYVVLQGPWMASSSVLKAANRHGSLSRLHLLSSLLGLGFAAALVGRLGVWAVPAGLMVGEALVCYHWAVKGTCNLIGESYARFSVELWVGLPLVGAGAMAAAWAASGMVEGHFLARWAATGALSLAAAGILTWWGWLRASERAMLQRWLASAAAALRGGRLRRAMVPLGEKSGR